MPTLTLQILEGMERGQVLRDLPLPVTIGREDDNTVRLNDDRISRFHIKIQEADGKLVLTDLESTNGTRINGFPVNIHVLQPGDLIAVGRCLLLVGSHEDILKTHAASFLVSGSAQASDSNDQNFSHPQAYSEQTQASQLPILFQRGCPALPTQLKALQIAELSDLLAYVHAHLSVAANYAQAQNSSQQQSRGSQHEEDAILVPVSVWQLLLKLEMDLAKSLRTLAHPE